MMWQDEVELPNIVHDAHMDSMAEQLRPAMPLQDHKGACNPKIGPTAHHHQPTTQHHRPASPPKSQAFEFEVCGKYIARSTGLAVQRMS